MNRRITLSRTSKSTGEQFQRTSFSWKPYTCREYQRLTQITLAFYQQTAEGWKAQHHIVQHSCYRCSGLDLRCVNQIMININPTQYKPGWYKCITTESESSRAKTSTDISITLLWVATKADDLGSGAWQQHQTSTMSFQSRLAHQLHRQPGSAGGMWALPLAGQARLGL